MQLKVEAVLTGWVLAGVVILLAVVSAIVGAATARSGGFDLFLARLAPPLGVGLLIVAATAVLQGIQDRRGGVVIPSTGASGASASASARRAGSGARRAVPNRAASQVRSDALQGPGTFRVASLVTGILGSLFSLGMGLFLIIVALTVRDVADDLGLLADATDLDEIVLWVLVGIGVILLVISGLGILGASLAMKQPATALVFLLVVAGINALIFILTLFGGEWFPIVLYLISTGLLTASAVCAFKGREELY